MKAINTHYKDYLFRSRLEARYAVFFDMLNIQWAYEYEGFDLGDSVWYLPDFWLPTFNGGMFAEVKPTEFNAAELEKAKRLVLQSGNELMMCIGTPDFKVIPYLNKEYCHEYGKVKGVGICYGLPNADQAQGENRMFIQPGYENERGFITPDYYSCLGDEYVKAVKRAKSIRFSKTNI